MSGPTAAVTGFFHGGVTVSDMDRALVFYRDGLGLEQAFDRALDAPYLKAVLGLEFDHIRAVYLHIPGGGYVELLEYVGIERLAAAVSLHHDRHHQLRGLEGGEPLAAAQALATAADLPPLARKARIRNFRIYVAAEGAVHAAPLGHAGSGALTARTPGSGGTGRAPADARAR